MSSIAPVHSVHFYDTNKALIDRLCAIVSSGLLTGSSVLIIATDQHQEELRTALSALGVDVPKYAREGRVVMYDAAETLAEFMVSGLPDEKLFVASVGKIFTEAKNVSRRKQQNLVVFGEMVAVLWEQGNRTGALALERLWNDLLNQEAFHLHCAYPRALFTEDHAGMMDICDTHSIILGVLAS